MFFFKFDTSKISFLARTSFLIAAFFGVDKILAFVRVGIVSRIYTDEVGLLDVFNSANNVPDVLFALISGGALAMAFIPLMSEYLTTKSREAAWDLFSRVANLAFLVTGSIAVLIFIFAQQIVDHAIVPGFTAEQRALVAELMRLNLVSTIIFSISGLVMASLQANQHFLLPALAPTMYNVGQIFGAIIFVPLFGIQGLVYGVILGAALHLAVQIPALFKFGFKWTPVLDLRHTGLLEALKLLGPRLLTMGGIQLIVIARDYLASLTGQEGAVTSLAFGWMIMQVPETLLGTAIATAMLPTLSELASRDGWHEFRLAIERALRVLIALTIPIAAVMAAGINPLVRAAFGFEAEMSTLITWTTRAYLITLTGYSIHEIAARSFYAQRADVPVVRGCFEARVIHRHRLSWHHDVQAYRSAGHCLCGDRPAHRIDLPLHLAQQTDARTHRRVERGGQGTRRSSGRRRDDLPARGLHPRLRGRHRADRHGHRRTRLPAHHLVRN